MEDEFKKLQASVDVLLAFKDRTEAAQAERLDDLHNAIVQVFVDRKATISEIVTVLDLVKAEATRNYAFTRKVILKNKGVTENAMSAVREPAPITTEQVVQETQQEQPVPHFHQSDE